MTTRMSSDLTQNPQNPLTLAAPTFKVGLTPEEKSLYSQLFKALDAEGSGIVTGEKARATFEKSGLPPNILGEIWQLADHSNLGFLTQFGFCYAMRLIGYTQAGQYPTAALADSPGPLPKFGNAALKPQLTNASLLQSQPTAVVPQNTATQQSSPQEPISDILPADYERYSQMFVKTTGSAAAPMDGNQAKDILMKARLPTSTLGQIWSLVDVNNRGHLDVGAFVVAMHLIHGLLSGTIKQLPPFLPEHVWHSVDKLVDVQGSRQASQSSVASTVRHTPAAKQEAQTEWTVSAVQKQQFDAMFESLDKPKTGTLSPDQVASFLMTSRLGQQDLATIWDLSDIDNTGIFNTLEFAIALFLVNRRRSGLPLPNVVPEQLINSISQLESGQKQLQQPQQVQQPQPPQVQLPPPKSSMDELADIFGSSSPAPVAAQPPARAPSFSQKPALQTRSSSSDLTPSSDLPKVRKQLTSSFKPTSTFGQSLLSQPSQIPEEPSLIGEDVQTSVGNTPAPADVVSTQPPVVVEKQRTVDYEALRSVPPPPPKKEAAPQAQQVFEQPQAPQRTQSVQQPRMSSTGFFQPQSPSVSTPPRSLSYQRSNSDLLADSEVSGQLSEANSDIANISNQVKSLTTQTSNLHEKKTRADRELARILAIKDEIDSKLKQLRASYANEVKQVEQVEATLATASEETEALRSEASISEAKLNLLSGELNDKQIALEELQKANASWREKLGYFNAEIVDLEKQLASKSAETVQLSNEANVRKSQVQVAFVKVDDLKKQIAETEAKHATMREQVAQAEKDREAAEQLARELQAKHEELKSKPLPQVSQSTASSSGSGLGAAVSVLAGAAVGGAAGIAGSHLFSSKKEETVAKTVAEPEVSASTREAIIPGSIEYFTHTPTEPEQVSKEAVESSEPLVSGLVDEVLEKPSQDLTGVDDFQQVEHEGTETSTKELPTAEVSTTPLVEESTKESSVSGLVDEVVPKSPTADVYSKAELTPDAFASPPSYESQDLDELSSRFPEVSNYESNFQEIDATAPSSVVDSYKQTSTSETPVTSPNNSEYQFQQSAAGVVGGMVGMPGVLMGVQRTDSLTSSVQNNASLSVRDDNIEDVSERETLDGEIPAAHAATEIKDTDARVEDSSDGERISSGVELFEMVNADEARGLDSQALDGHTPHVASTQDEFPPIKELDYDESSSSEDESPDKFDDAVDHMASPPAAAGKLDDEFDATFNDLTPATQEKAVHEDMFDDEFDDLQEAHDAGEEDFEAEQGEIPLDSHFTGADFGNDFGPSGAPNFAAASTTLQPDANDEWEQLFAGFGNAAPAVVEQPTTNTSTKDLAVQELTGMGFDEATVVEALTKENWDIEAATNYLLDHA